MGEVIGELLHHLFTSGESLIAVSVFAILFCVNGMYAMGVIIINEKIHHIRTEKSMQEVEQFGVILRKMLESHYLKLAKKYLGDDYYNHMENYLYTFLIRVPLEHVHTEFRRRIRENGFELKTDLQYLEYVEDCKKEDNSIFTGRLNEVYYRNSEVPRTELYDHNQELLKELNVMYDSLFKDILQIANDHKYRKFYKMKLKLRF
ncbi:hypothetical protein KAR91_69650 [Candidatus Pacearchaeota archaeon]|nr:hypothetical protein [Candidatus Pacearchaeota archaeon]